ncbi:MAG TPA: Spy/CpxP family protein refolding chaperone [Holophaga sp.]|nr:Spy/CpxP family protein refolding chaperone [Holophaga sp.]
MHRPIKLCALALGLGILPLAAHPRGPFAGASAETRGTFMLGRLAERLKLTESQKTQIQDILARHKETAGDKAKAAWEAARSFRDASQDPATPPAQLKTLYQASSDKRFELMLDLRARRSEVRAILTPEQRTELDKLQAYGKGFRRGRFGARGFGPGSL